MDALGFGRLVDGGDAALTNYFSMDSTACKLRTNTWRRTWQETNYPSRDVSPETDRFPVVSRPMCYSFCNTNYHSRYATGKSDSHHFPGLRCYSCWWSYTKSGFLLTSIVSCDFTYLRRNVDFTLEQPQTHRTHVTMTSMPTGKGVWPPYVLRSNLQLKRQ